MTTIRFEVVGIDENIVKVDDDRVVEEILEDVVHEALKRHGGVGQAFGNNQPFEGTIAGTESGFPLVAVGDAHKMVRVPEVDLRIVAGLARTLQEIGDERKRVMVLLG